MTHREFQPSSAHALSDPAVAETEVLCMATGRGIRALSLHELCAKAQADSHCRVEPGSTLPEISTATRKFIDEIVSDKVVESAARYISKIAELGGGDVKVIWNQEGRLTCAEGYQHLLGTSREYEIPGSLWSVVTWTASLDGSHHEAHGSLQSAKLLAPLILYQNSNSPGFSDSNEYAAKRLALAEALQAKVATRLGDSLDLVIRPSDRTAYPDAGMDVRLSW